MAAIDALDVIEYNEGQLEALFRRSTTLGIDSLLNSGTGPDIDVASQTIRNDRCWKGFFPEGHVLNAMSSAIFTGFRKEFHKEGNRYTGITSDTDGRIHAHNSLEEVHFDRATETLEAGRYILLRYLDFPWQGFYDIFKIVNQDLLLGRVYLGEFPNGSRVFTFAMSRRYGFAQMTADDHAVLFNEGATPAAADLEGVWRMDAIANANHAGGVAYLEFRSQPDGRFEAHYELMGLMEGLVVPSFLKDHFQLNDFTPFHDEIRKVSDDFLVGKYVLGLPPAVAAVTANSSLGLFHSEAGGQFGFYYTLSRAAQKELPTNTLLRPFLDAQLPDGVGMTFDEQMTGWYFPGQGASEPGRAGDLAIANRIPAAGAPAGAAACSFAARIVVRDVNEFVDGYEHEAGIRGSITFGQFEGQGPATFAIDEPNSRFQYLRINPATREAEMRYHIEFRSAAGRRFALDGTKYMQRDSAAASDAIRELLGDYTTLYCHVSELTAAPRETGTAWLKFHTFEDLAAVGNLAGFLASFQITGTSDPLIQFQARMRFLGFTAQFVAREYDPLGMGARWLAEDVRVEVQRGAEAPDYFSTRPAAELQNILHDAPGHPLESLLNHLGVTIDWEAQRIFRDSFWKGSFAEDSLLGWEEKLRDKLLGAGAREMGQAFAGGSFWKRFDSIRDGVATGYVVNYEIQALPGLPEVRQVAYPDDNRRYFKKGDPVLLLNYTNDPYRMVYDVIKVIDDRNAIGVMHLGEFPNGVEFATFVMARNNYPFDNMSIPDFGAVFGDPRASAPVAAQIEGPWDGHLIFVAAPEKTLLNQVNPALFHVEFHTENGQTQVKCRAGLVTAQSTVQNTPEFVLAPGPAGSYSEIRMTGADTLVGRWVGPALDPAVAGALGGCLAMEGGQPVLYFVLKRAQ
jgi:hypothetical protein